MLEACRFMPASWYYIHNDTPSQKVIFAVLDV